MLWKIEKFDLNKASNYNREKMRKEVSEKEKRKGIKSLIKDIAKFIFYFVLRVYLEKHSMNNKRRLFFLQFKCFNDDFCVIQINH